MRAPRGLSGFEIRHLAARVFGNVAVVRLQPTWKLSARHLSRPDVLKR